MSNVHLRKLCITRGSNQVIRDLDLHIEPGEFLVLLGPSGCGKSTLLHSIAGLIDLADGSIEIGGRDMSYADPSERGIGMVFQSYALYPTMTVEKNMSFGLRISGAPKAEIQRRVRKAAEMLQLESLLDRKPAQLSGGQRQRVAIGRALVREAGVYLFDEPLSNLDAKLRAELRCELKMLHQALGSTMIYVTHDQAEAMTLATRIVVMQGGRIQQIGTPGEVYERPANRFVAGFLGSPSMNFVDGRLEGELDVQRRFSAGALTL
jgi:multiple sugar transport system ATP-binding protein